MLLGFVTNNPLALVAHEFHPDFAGASSPNPSYWKSFPGLLWVWPPPNFSFSSHSKCPIGLAPFTALEVLGRPPAGAGGNGAYKSGEAESTPKIG